MNNSRSAVLVANPNPKPEYVIYSFEKDELSKGAPVWSRLKSVNCEIKACAEAQSLFQTAKFARIEVRCKSVNEKTGMLEDKAVKILDSAPARMKKFMWLFVSALGCACAAGIIVVLG